MAYLFCSLICARCSFALTVLALVGDAAAMAQTLSIEDAATRLRNQTITGATIIAHAMATPRFL